MKLIGYCISTCDNPGNIFYPRGDMFAIYIHNETNYIDKMFYRVNNVMTNQRFENKLGYEDVLRNGIVIKESKLLKLILL